MSDSDALVYRFSADTSSLKAGLNDVKSQLASLGASAHAQGQAVSSGFDSVTGALNKVKETAERVTFGVAALAAAASAFLIGVGEHAVQLGDSVKRAAGAFDQTIAAMGEVKAVADRSGSSLDDVGKAFLSLQQKARTGDDVVTHALAAIGMSASSVATLTQRELAVKMADTFASLKDSSNKAAAAVALFGPEVAAKLTPMLDRGSESIIGLMEAAHRAGAVIGPELSLAISGTSGAFDRFNDRVAELKLTFEGMALQAFSKFKAAIDGLMLSFTDVVGNIATLIEWFKNLNGAGEGAVRSFGLLKTGADIFARAMISAIAYVEELAVGGAKWLDDLGVSFDGLAHVVKAFGDDVREMAGTAASSLYNAFHEAIQGVVVLFGDLAAAGAKALSFDFSGVKAAFAQLGNDAAGVGDRIKGALSADFLAKTKAAYEEMRKGAGAHASELDAVIAKIEEQKRKQLELVAAGGAKAQPAGRVAAGDPTVPKSKDAASDAKDAVERYLDSLNKANKTAQAEAETWMKSNVERAKAVALAQLQAAAEKDNVTLTEEQKTKAAQLATQTQTLKDKVESLRSAAQGLSETFADALDQLIVKGGKLNDVLKQVLQTFASAALKASLTGDGMFGGLFGGQAGTGGLFGSLFKGLFSGFKAEGGPVMGGRAYVVGERGPELFQPNGGGVIVPNGGGGNAGGGVAHIQVSVVGANGDAQIQRMVMSGVQAGLKQFSAQVLPGRIDELNLRNV